MDGLFIKVRPDIPCDACGRPAQVAEVYRAVLVLKRKQYNKLYMLTTQCKECVAAQMRMYEENLPPGRSREPVEPGPIPMSVHTSRALPCFVCGAETNDSQVVKVPYEEGDPWNRSVMLKPLCESHQVTSA